MKKLAYFVLMVLLFGQLLAKVPERSILYVDLDEVHVESFEKSVYMSRQWHLDCLHSYFLYSGSATNDNLHNSLYAKEASAIKEADEKFKQTIERTLRFFAKKYKAVAIQLFNADNKPSYINPDHIITKEFIEKLNQECSQEVLLQHALQDYSPEKMKNVIKKGFAINDDLGQSLLFYAANMRNRTLTIEYLVVDLGIAVNAELLNYVLRHQNDPETFRALAKAKNIDTYALFNDGGRDWTFLELGIRWNYPEMILLVIENDLTLRQDTMVSSHSGKEESRLIDILRARNVTKEMAAERCWDDYYITPEIEMAIQELLMRG